MEDDIMDWFDVIKNVEMDESKLEGYELSEENCCVNIWKSIHREQPKVYMFLQRRTSLWADRHTTDGCSRLIEWLRQGAVFSMDAYKGGKRLWNPDGRAMNRIDYAKYITNKKKGWLQDYVDCYNLKNKTNRPQLEMY